MRIAKIYLLAVFSILFSSCDDGDLPIATSEETGGFKASIQLTFQGIEAWPSAYQLVFAAYGEDKETPILSKQIAAPKSETEEVSLTLNGLPEETRSVGISLLTKGRKLIYSYYSTTTDGKDFLLPVKQIDIACFDRIQEQIFDRYCVACHGDTDHAAAGLHLSKGKSYPALVNQIADLSPEDACYVQPGSAKKSFLYSILTEDIVRYNHTDVLPEAELVALIKIWINQGANN